VVEVFALPGCCVA